MLVTQGTGATEEKPEIVARVNWSGVGVGLRTAQPKPELARTDAPVRGVAGCQALLAA